MERWSAGPPVSFLIVSLYLQKDVGESVYVNVICENHVERAVNSVTSNGCPLFVDMDGSLVATDTLWESLLQLLHQQWYAVLLLPIWLTKGRAYFKREIARRVNLDPTSLPYRQSVIDYLKQAKLEGRKLFLATASDKLVADAVARHLSLFDGVLASDGQTNYKSDIKLSAIQDRTNSGEFDYIGDSSSDIPIWRSSRQVLVVNPSPMLRNKILNFRTIDKIFDEPGSRARAVLRMMRIHQWMKNILVFVPLFLAHQVTWDNMMLTGLAFFSFGCIASSVYIINDLFDLESDRTHSVKRQRPLASGEISIFGGVLVMVGLFAVGFAVSIAALPGLFSLVLVGYVLLALVYSAYLKRKAVVDVLALGSFYALRIIAGGVAVDVLISPWLLGFSMFLFPSLAFAKRYTELIHTDVQDDGKLAGRGYYAVDLDMIRVVGPTLGYLSILVMALYISSSAVAELYAHPEWLWLLCPCFLYWITRVWFFVQRDQMPHDPVMFALQDKISIGVGLIMLAIIFVSSKSF